MVGGGSLLSRLARFRSGRCLRHVDCDPGRDSARSLLPGLEGQRQRQRSVAGFLLLRAFGSRVIRPAHPPVWIRLSADYPACASAVPRQRSSSPVDDPHSVLSVDQQPRLMVDRDDGVRHHHRLWSCGGELGTRRRSALVTPAVAAATRNLGSLCCCPFREPVRLPSCFLPVRLGL